MKTILMLLILCVALLAQTPAGTVTVASTITATATSGSASAAVTCVITTPALPAVRVVCSVGSTQMLTMDVTPSVGTANGASGTFNNAGNAVTWLFQQPTAGNVTWQLAANGTAKSGTF